MRAARVSALTERVAETVAGDRLRRTHDQFGRRLAEIGRAGEFGSVYSDEQTSETRSYAALIPELVEAQEKLDLESYSDRRRMAYAVADRVELCMQRLGWCPRWAQDQPTRLRLARRSGRIAYAPLRGKFVMWWDVKAALPRLDPDDGREEAMRVSRRYVPELVRLQSQGRRIYKAVLTTPNAPPDRLRGEMERIYKLFRALLQSKRFPEIEGALCVQEAPLGWAHDWNVHLNVIFVIKRGAFFCYKKLREAWGANLDIGLLAHGEEALRGALTELIKYAIRPTPTKSEEKAGVARVPGDSGLSGAPIEGRSEADDSAGASPPGGQSRADAAPELEPFGDASTDGPTRDSPFSGAGDRGPVLHGPAFTCWPDERIKEWLKAQQRFRRTRSYGCLFALKKPETEDLGPMLWLGSINYRGGRYRARFPLLDSIPEDKSHPGDPLAAYQQLRRRLRSPPWPTSGCELPRLAELT